MPRPGKGESKGDFVSRCMGSAEARRDYPEQDQRLAVCNSLYEGARKMAEDRVELRAEVARVNGELGLVMGFAIICKEAGKPYYDLQGHHIPEASMAKAALDFMESPRVAKEMHKGEQAGTVVFAFPLTEDVAKAFELETKKTGLMIAMKPSKAMMKRFKSGELTGFSIGGAIVEKEDEPDA